MGHGTPEGDKTLEAAAEGFADRLDQLVNRGSPDRGGLEREAMHAQVSVQINRPGRGDRDLGFGGLPGVSATSAGDHAPGPAGRGPAGRGRSRPPLGAPGPDGHRGKSPNAAPQEPAVSNETRTASRRIRTAAKAEQKDLVPWVVVVLHQKHVRTVHVLRQASAQCSASKMVEPPGTNPSVVVHPLSYPIGGHRRHHTPHQLRNIGRAGACHL